MKKVNWSKLHDRINNKMQIASKVYYEIVWTDEFPNNPNVLGETRFNPNQIVIKNNQSPKETVGTYLHEILHAVSDAYDIGLTETQVQKLEKALPYILKEGNVFK